MASFDFKLAAEDPSMRFRLTRAQALFFAFLCLCLLIFAALLIAILVILLKNQTSDQKNQFSSKEIRASIFGNIKGDRIATNLRAFTEKPHQAGTEANKAVADKITELWKANGLEDVHQVPYDVLLSYPKWESPNHVSILASNGRVLFRTTGLSPDLTGNDNSPEASIQWLAYIPEGTAQGEPVYCNYGRVQDFEYLEKNFGIKDLKGKIAIMRYGKNFRGDMVHHAYQRGAIGAIIYSDPAEVAKDGTEHVYPHSNWMPSVGVQRGSTLLGHGDPLSPLLPSRKDFHRERTIEQVRQNPDIMSQIPVLPLSYGDAYHILSKMDGPEVKSKYWKGGLNITYRVGPGFKGGQERWVKVEVHSKLEVRTIQNVIGYIWGSEYPDEWVMLGNHYDAWVFGAIDPNSGTSVLTEVGKAIADTVHSTGWRPKRTLVFCAWDSEEYGLHGSTEFVEEFGDVLRERAVVYINVDNISGNETLYVRAVPTLYQAAVQAAKMVRNPVDQQQTLYDNWLAHYPSETEWLPGVPKMTIPGGGSDQVGFLNFLGIPVVDFTFHGHGYPLYHTRYELPFVNEHIFDHNHLAVHKAIGEYWSALACLFADSALLPISASTFAHRLLSDYMEDVKKAILELNRKFPAASEAAKRQLDNLIQNGHQLVAQAEEFERGISANLNRANGRLRRLDQCFVNPSMGLAREEPEKRNVLFSTSKDNFYASSMMSMVNKKIRQFNAATDEAERARRGNEMALELTVVQQAVRCAVSTLRNGV